MSEDDKKPALNEAMVRAILTMNPQLRGDGESTKTVMDKMTAMQGGAAPAAPVTKPLPQAPKLHEIVRDVRGRYGEEMTARDKQRAALLARRSALEGERRALGEAACEVLIETFRQFDPNLTRREHQVLLANEKSFFDSIRFSAERLLAAMKR